MPLITPDAAKAELAKRKKLKAKENVESADIKILQIDSKFPEQNRFIDDTSRQLAAQCSRRAGKSSGLARKFIKTMEKYPNETCVYLALTRDSARDIMLPVIQELEKLEKLGLEIVESKLLIKHPNGAKLKLYGADQKNFIKRLKGRKFPGIGVDEAQDFGNHLESLIDDVLTPCTADFEDGWLALTGTPGAIPKGYFFDVTQNGKYGFSVHKWTLIENPYMPNPEAFISWLMQKKDWPANHPTLLREYRNKWVLDTEALWIRYLADRNHYEEMPKNIQWNYILGVDIGFKDADALAVLAWSEDSDETYLVEELIEEKAGVTELANNINHLWKKYKTHKMVIDSGALGKKIAEELRRRHKLPLEDADKTRKQENVEFLNDELRTGRFKAKKDSRFAEDSYMVQVDWEKSTPDKLILKKTFHSDIIDAVLYGFKVSPAYAYQKDDKEKIKTGSPEDMQRQEDEMFETALEHHLEREQQFEEYGFDPNDLYDGS